MRKNIIINISENDTDIYFSFEVDGKITSYSPVILAIYIIGGDIIYYFESKNGELKHAYSINNDNLVDISLLENKDPIHTIIDKQRF